MKSKNNTILLSNSKFYVHQQVEILVKQTSVSYNLVLHLISNLVSSASLSSKTTHPKMLSS